MTSTAPSLQALTGLLAADALTQEEIVSRFEGVQAPMLLGELSVIDGRSYAPKEAQSLETAQPTTRSTRFVA